MALLQNPILERELRSRWRRPLTYVVLLGYAAILSWVAWQLAGTAMMQSASLVEGFASEGDKAQKLPGKELFEKSVAAQVLVALWASAMLCAPVIARERELRMLPELILANLSPAQIVRGKWLATLGFASILLLIPLPLQALAFLLGGVSPGDWAGAALLQIAAMILGSAIGLWCSAQSHRVAGAMSTACVGCVLASFPLGLGASNISYGPWVSFSFAILCFFIAAPLMAGAQSAVRDLPLDPPRPPASELPSSHSLPEEVRSWAREDATVRDLQSVMRAAQRAMPERSLPQSTLAAQELATAEVPVEVPARHDAKVYGAARESWMFPLLRALNWHNPLVWRELRVRLRQPFFDVSTLLLASLCLLALPALLTSLFDGQTHNVSIVVLPFWGLCGVTCALRAAQGFTREREQKMLESLLLSTMSPLSIVVGKVAAPILLSLYAATLPLILFAAWALGWSVFHGTNIASIALAGCAGFGLLGASCGTWLSFWCRTSSVSAVGSMAMFLGLVGLPGTLFFAGSSRIQAIVETLWMAPVWWPLRAFDGSLAFWGAGMSMCVLLVGVSLALLGHIVLALRPQALDREGRSLLHTDLTRNLH